MQPDEILVLVKDLKVKETLDAMHKKVMRSMPMPSLKLEASFWQGRHCLERKPRLHLAILAPSVSW